MNTNNAKPEKTYEEKINKYNYEMNDLQKKSSRISLLRFFVFLSGAALASLLFYKNFILLAWACILLFLPIFIFLVFHHDKIKHKIKVTENLLKVNQLSVDRLEDRWHQFSDSGEEYVDDKHPFSFDLDIFGKGSLFQWINSTGTFLGRKKLVKKLTSIANNKNDILHRQEAIKELSKNIDFRQKLQALGILDKNLLTDPTPIIEWAENKERIIGEKKYLKNIVRFFSCSALLSLFLYIFSEQLGISTTVERYLRDIFLFIIIIHMGLTMKYFKKIHRAFDVCITFKENITTYKHLLKLIENSNFSSNYLLDIKNQLFSKTNNNSSFYINKLENTVDCIKLKFSNIHFIITILTLWDFYCLMSLEKWKDNAGENLQQWLNAIGKFEELSSLSIINFDNPQWIFPSIRDEDYKFIGKNLGHPLISSQKRINNDFTCNGPGNITIITGSNMSGKSTMLRTVGINALLSYTGAPVCATECQCSIMDIYTSMRIKDNLEENISTFYAELLRIKMVIEASEKNTILFLFDEILRGTNTRDRKCGVEAIIKQLADNKALGIVATHDTEIADMKEENNNINAFYFKENYVDDKIFFDYKLYPGISDTSDAVYLMKMIGIRLDHE